MNQLRMKTLGQRLGMWIVLLACLHLSLNFAVGRIVVAVFSKGTGCQVALSDPQVRYFPLRATAKNIHLYHPTEGPAGGFRVARLDISLEFLPILFRKKIIVNELNLQGSNVTSIGEDTGFIKVLEFLFKKDKQPKRKTTWNSFLTSGWSAWVQRVQIETAPSTSNNFLIGTDEIQVVFDQATFITSDPIDSKKQPVLIDAYGTNMRVQYKESPLLPLGRVDIVGQIGGGVASFKRIVLTDDTSRLPENRTSRTEASGTLSFRDVERYDIQFTGKLFDYYLARLIYPAHDYILQLKPQGEIEGRVQGGLTSPEVSGNFTFGLGKGAPLMVRDACAVKHFSAAFAVSTERLILEKIQLEDVVKEGSLQLAFEDRLPVEGRIVFAVGRDSSYLRRCVPPTGGASETNTENNLEPFSLAINKALADSLTTIEAGGELKTLEFDGRLVSEIYANTAYAHSNLQANFSITPKRVALTLQERGLVPQISNLPLRDQDARKTPFQTQINSNVSAKLSFDFETEQLAVEQLDISRYPTDRIAARAAPFLSQRWYDEIARYLSRDSLLDAKADLQFSFRDRTGRGDGKVSLSGLQIGPLAVQSVHMPIGFREGAFSSDQIEIVTEEGTMKGAASVGLDGALKAQLSATEVGLNSLSPVDTGRFDVQGEYDLDLTLEGTIQQPVYRGSLTARTRIGQQAEQSPPQRSEIAIEGTSKQFSLGGSLLDGHAELQLQYPLRSDTGQKLVVHLRTQQFPLDFLIGGNADTAAARSDQLADNSLLTSRLLYEGSPDSPLAGSGELVVSKLLIDRQGVRVTHQEPLTAVIKDGRLEFTRVFLNLGSKVLQLKGYVDQQSGWHSSLLGDWDLGALTALVPQLEQFSGLLKIDLEIFGPPLQPELRGDISLQEGSISFPLGDSIVGAQRATAIARFRGDTVYLEQFEARLGEGWVVGRGSVKHFSDAIARRAQADFLIRGARVEPVDNLAVAFGGVLSVAQSGKSPLGISGDIEFTEAVYEKRLNLAEVIKSITRYVIGSDTMAVQRSAQVEDESRSPVELDVRLRARSGLLVETDIAKADLRGEVRLFGPPQLFRLDGSVTIEDAVFVLGSNEFDVITGEVEFSPQGPRLDPRLDIVAETIVGGETGEQHNVRMAISNTLSDPVVRFTSDSGLSENEIVALFGLGTGGVTLLSGLRGERTFRELLDPRSDVSLRERLAGLAGFSEVQIASGLSENTGEFVPTLNARRPLIGKSDLLIESELSGEQLSEIGVDYPLTPYLSLSGGWRSRPVTEDVNDTSGSYHVGLRFRRSFSGLTIVPLRKPKVQEIDR